MLVACFQSRLRSVCCARSHTLIEFLQAAAIPCLFNIKLSFRLSFKLLPSFLSSFLSSFLPSFLSNVNRSASCLVRSFALFVCSNFVRSFCKLPCLPTFLYGGLTLYVVSSACSHSLGIACTSFKYASFQLNRFPISFLELQTMLSESLPEGCRNWALR